MVVCTRVHRRRRRTDCARRSRFSPNGRGRRPDPTRDGGIVTNFRGRSVLRSKAKRRAGAALTAPARDRRQGRRAVRRQQGADTSSSRSATAASCGRARRSPPTGGIVEQGTSAVRHGACSPANRCRRGLTRRGDSRRTSTRGQADRPRDQWSGSRHRARPDRDAGRDAHRQGPRSRAPPTDSPASSPVVVVLSWPRWGYGSGPAESPTFASRRVAVLISPARRALGLASGPEVLDGRPAAVRNSG